MVTQIQTTNGDVQFTSTGDATLDFISKGASVFLDRLSDDIHKKVSDFVSLAKGAFKEDQETACKIARFFRDSTGQKLKEQPLLFIASLADELSEEQIESILTVQPSGPGSISLNRVKVIDLVKTVAWHKTLNGKDAKLPIALRNVVTKTLASNEKLLIQVLKNKTKNVRFHFGIKEKKSIGVLDLLGMVVNNKIYPISEEVVREYKEYLYPRYRCKDNSVQPVNEITKMHRAYFQGKLKSGDVPEGITPEQLLQRKDTKGLASLAKRGELSQRQIKANLNLLGTLLSDDEYIKLTKNLIIDMPHELYSMALSCEHNSIFRKACDQLLVKLIDKYKEINKKNVICLADTSASMNYPTLTKNTLITPDLFAVIMSYITAHCSGHRIFGEWAGDAHLFRASKTPFFEEFMTAKFKHNVNTDVVNCIKTVANSFASKGDPVPEVLVFISDMQFYSAIPFKSSKAQNISQAVSVGIDYYKSKTGIEPEIIFWNVTASTTPAIKKNGVLQMSGYSANNISLMFGAVNDSADKAELLDPEAIINYVRTHYN
jgi:hypothetical protein